MDEGGATPRTSWSTVAVAIATACAVIVALAWVVLTRPAGRTESAGMPVLLPSASASPAGPMIASESDAVPKDLRPQQSENAKNSPRRPPKLAVQVFDTQQGQCPKTFAVSVNIYVVRGRVDKATATLSVPKEHIVRDYPLIPVAGDFSSLIRGVPTEEVAHLTVSATGPGGTTEEWHDITHECPWKTPDPTESANPLDKKKGKGLFGDLKKIEAPDVDFDFDFDFDGGAESGAGPKSAESTKPGSD